MKLIDQRVVHPAFALLVQQGEKNHTFVDPLVRLERKNVAIQRVFKQEIAPLAHGFVEGDNLEPIGLVDQAIGLHLYPGMSHVPQIIGQSLMRDCVGGKMSEITVGKSTLGPSPGLVKELEPHVPGVRALVIRKIFFTENDVSHEIAVQEILLMLLKKTVDSRRD